MGSSPIPCPTVYATACPLDQADWKPREADSQATKHLMESSTDSTVLGS